MMAYKKQGFVDGTVLYASPLNKMDEQIYNNTDAIGDLTSLKTVSQTTLVDAINEIAESGSSGASLDVLISETEPTENSVLWFDTSAYAEA